MIIYVGTLSVSAGQKLCMMRQRKSRRVAVMAGWGRIEWCITRMAGSMFMILSCTSQPDNQRDAAPLSFSLHGTDARQ